MFGRVGDVVAREEISRFLREKAFWTGEIERESFFVSRESFMVLRWVCLVCFLLEVYTCLLCVIGFRV